MHSLLRFQMKLLPDLLAVMQKRYDILRYIKFMQPVGRRSLAASLNITERTLRSEVEFLKKQSLIEIFSSGMMITEEGSEILHELSGVIREISGIDVMEHKVSQVLNIKEVIIVPGDSDESPVSKSELGKACATRMKKEWHGENIIAVTGGTTMAEVANMLTPDPNGKNILFVPARGGFGEDVHNEANTIVSKMAEKSNASYKALYIPEQVSEEAYHSFMKEPMIEDVMSLIKSADMVIHGIGDAMAMAKRRKTAEDILQVLKEKNAAGEAFGYYFDENGQIIHKVQTVGIQLEDLNNTRTVIAVAGGKSKAKAVRSYIKRAPSTTILITDQAAASELIKG